RRSQRLRQRFADLRAMACGFAEAPSSNAGEECWEVRGAGQPRAVALPGTGTRGCLGCSQGPRRYRDSANRLRNLEPRGRRAGADDYGPRPR
ncbi:unnamed protein product, partial [Symbiodinium sp. CCMP2456]